MLLSVITLNTMICSAEPAHLLVHLCEPESSNSIGIGPAVSSHRKSVFLLVHLCEPESPNSIGIGPAVSSHSISVFLLVNLCEPELPNSIGIGPATVVPLIVYLYFYWSICVSQNHQTQLVLVLSSCFHT